jgi:glutaredoxin
VNHGARLELRRNGRASRARLLVLVAALIGCVAMLMSCRHSNKSSPSTRSNEPVLQLTDTTKDILLTWVDEQGDFHVTQSIGEVKEPARAQVRVVFAERGNDTPDQVLVADLRQTRADGTYALTTMTRSAWDDIGARNRKSRMEAISAPAVLPDAGLPAQDRVAIIYGAEWCKACHETARYLKSKGVKYVEKDVDASNTIQAELQAKLARAHVPPTSSIPVTDINGHLVVGFNPAALDSAIATKGNQTL